MHFDIYIYIDLDLCIYTGIRTVSTHDFLNAKQFKRDADGSLSLGSARQLVWILFYIL